MDMVSRVNIFRTDPNGRGPRCVGAFTLCDAISVNFVLWENRDGSFALTLPRTENAKFDPNADVSDKNKKYFDEVRIVSAEVRTQLTELLVQKYKEHTSGSSTQGNRSVPSTANMDGIPF